MEKEKLIELLNEALQTEYTDVFLYPRQADMVRAEEGETAEKFDGFGRMELRHADNIASHILALGGRPVWEFKLLDTKESLDEMLTDHLEQEGKAVGLYSSLVELSDKEGEEQLKLILEGIEAEEVSHQRAIKELIEKRKTK